MSSPKRNWPAINSSATFSFSQSQVLLLESWKEGHEDWHVQILDCVGIDTRMIVVELPPYLDIDGLGLNLNNWVIYPMAGEAVRVRFWDDCESHYPKLEAALRDIACLRALRA